MMCQGSLRGMFGVGPRFVRGHNTVMSGSDIYLLGGATRLCRRRYTVMLGAHIGYVGGDTRLCRRRYTVMLGASIGYVRGAHRLCRRRASMHQGRRHYCHNRYNRCAHKKGRQGYFNPMPAKGQCHV